MRHSMIGIALVLTFSVLPFAGRAIAAGPFDGNYGGAQKTTVNNNAGYCQNLDHNVMLSIQNNIISYPWGRTMLQATVGADGLFSVEQPGLQMRGANTSNQ